MGMHKDIYNPEAELEDVRILDLEITKLERYSNSQQHYAHVVTDPGDDKLRGRNRHQRRKMAALSRKWKR